MESDSYLRLGRALIKRQKYEGEALQEGRPLPSLRLLKQLHISTPRLPWARKRTPPGERNIPTTSSEENTGPPNDAPVAQVTDAIPLTDDAVQPQSPPVETENQPTTRDSGVEVPEKPPQPSPSPLLPSPPREPSISSDVTVVEAPQQLQDKPTNTSLPPTWTPPLQTVLTFHLYFLLFLIMQLAVLCFLYAFVFVLSLIGLRFATT